MCLLRIQLCPGLQIELFRTGAVLPIRIDSIKKGTTNSGAVKHEPLASEGHSQVVPPTRAIIPAVHFGYRSGSVG